MRTMSRLPMAATPAQRPISTSAAGRNRDLIVKTSVGVIVDTLSNEAAAATSKSTLGERDQNNVDNDSNRDEHGS